MITKTLSQHNTEALAAEAVEYLLEGGVVMLPTDTAYALAADATNKQAVSQVFDLKGREETKSVGVVVSGLEQARQIAEVSPLAEKLWAAFMPGPLTMVLTTHGGTGLAGPVTHNGHTVGIRCPKLEVATLVAERLGRPFTATSANRSGQPPAYDPAEFLSELGEGDVPPQLVIDGGILPMVPVSTVVDLTGDTPRILRAGAIPEADIMELGATE
jgi:L-threonylcarbamoyladenylate synthase